jgi:hypothetical protein
VVAVRDLAMSARLHLAVAAAVALLGAGVARADAPRPASGPATQPARATQPAAPATQPAPPATRPAAPATQPAAPASAPGTTYKTRAGTVLLEEDGPARFSLPTESDRAAWRKPGFRVSLGLTWGELFGVKGPPDGMLLGPFVRFGVRLDPRWSLLATLQYHFAWHGVSGIRYGGTLEPTWHLTERLSLAIGLGFGGIVERSTDRPNPAPLPDSLETSYTFPNAKNPIPSCSGVGVAGLVRGEYLFIVGPRASTGFAAEVAGQWTGCVENTGRTEPDTAKAIVRRQWWPHVGLTLSWVMAWR